MILRRFLALLLALAACKAEDRSSPEPTPAAPAPASAEAEAPPAPTGDEATAPERDDHVVVFSDRATAAYLLLLREPDAKLPTRAELVALVKRKLQDGPEITKLVELVEREPVAPQGGSLGGPTDEAQANVRRMDLLGLHIELLSLRGDKPPIPPESLAAEPLVRLLTPAERKSLPDRTHALLLRAQYRNRDAVRGLRLLQTLVRLVAAERGALVHDAETQETMGVDAFSERRLRSGLGNVADQIVVVPFADTRHGKGLVRLTTRGMRRFASVDLELDGLPEDLATLQRGTHLLQGLAYRMVRMGEYDPQGYASQVDEEIEIELDDVRQAYSSRGVQIPACEACPREVAVHLVERASEPHDPVDHVVARVVAPPDRSGAAGYDQTEWAPWAIELLLGP